MDAAARSGGIEYGGVPVLLRGVCYAAGQTSPALGLPLAIVYAGPLLGLTLSIFRSLGRIVAETKIVIGKEAP